jgi:hypothetical protein
LEHRASNPVSVKNLTAIETSTIVKFLRPYIPVGTKKTRRRRRKKKKNAMDEVCLSETQVFLILQVCENTVKVKYSMSSRTEIISYHWNVLQREVSLNTRKHSQWKELI